MSPRLFKISPLEFLAPMIVGCALFMELLNSTVISTALPVMARSLGESPIRLNLAITSYLLSLAVFIPISGWMSDKFGSRTVFRSAIAIFTVGSVLCGLSQSLPELVAARISGPRRGDDDAGRPCDRAEDRAEVGAGKRCLI